MQCSILNFSSARDDTTDFLWQTAPSDDDYADCRGMVTLGRQTDRSGLLFFGRMPHQMMTGKWWAERGCQGAEGCDEATKDQKSDFAKA